MDFHHISYVDCVESTTTLLQRIRSVWALLDSKLKLYQIS